MTRLNLPPAPPLRPAPPDAFTSIGPVKMFDDLYYFGNKIVGMYVLVTSEGLVIFDSTQNENAYEDYVKPGLEALGLSDQKIIVNMLTHGHFDHFLGAPQIQQKTGCLTALSYKDTAFMAYGYDNHEGTEYKPYPIPKINLLLEDQKDYIYGDHTIHVIHAPGHTPGCLCFVFNVHHNGVEHHAALMGGYGIFPPRYYRNEVDYRDVQLSVDEACDFASSCVKFWLYAKEKHADVYLNPHPHLCGFFEYSKANAEGDGKSNAFIIGESGVKDWILERFNASLNSIRRFSGFDD